MHPLRAHRRILAAALVGTAVEFYDFYIYATAAALVFGPLFFPAESAAAQTLFALMSFGIAFIARPVGAVAFGHFGDRIGRKSTLVASLMLMGASTLLIAFLPTYAMAGWVAPLLLCILRFGQGFGLGGEWGGAALLAVENAPKGWEARFGAAPQLGAPVGFLAANGLFLLLGLGLSDQDFREWGWRVPFLASAVLVGVGLWVRLRIGETREFREAIEREVPPPVPLARLLAHHSGAVLAGSAGVIACFAIFYLATAYALAQGTGALGYPRETFLAVQLAANCFLAVGIVLAALHSDRASPRRVLMIGALATVVLGLVFGAGLGSGSLWLVFATLAAALLVMGYVYGPLGAWLPTLFPVPVRYSGISVAFNAGGIVGGAVTPVLAQMLAVEGRGGQAGLLLSAAGLVTLLGVSLARPPRDSVS
ncbi:MFS transporter [Novosphingobium sp. G106]|uniref:MFS transporter n=1 Tax=Novosphingobium sp. G106 TaxID=2849500 RepID=UPI001C2CF2B0|nr:MFS transporter [Novosphingobium sp. G106]MBV1686480.1 MFS transporter [Novosphingobium sp. G106]